ncbi:Rv1733c family protein [Nocardia thraciensis]
MSPYRSMLLRAWRARPWNGSRLMRPTDRLEGLIRILAIVVVLAAVPLCGALGTARYTAAQSEIRAENSEKAEVVAVVTSDPERVTSVTTHEVYDNRHEAAVRWNLDGVAGAATVEVPAAAAPGDERTVWLGPDRSPTEPPSPASVAAWRGIGLGLAVLIEAWAVAAVVVWLTTWLLSRRREAGWEREWRQLSRPIGQDQ